MMHELWILCYKVVRAKFWRNLYYSHELSSTLDPNTVKHVIKKFESLVMRVTSELLKLLRVLNYLLLNCSDLIFSKRAYMYYREIVFITCTVVRS